MIAAVYIQPHERQEAIVAYQDRLTYEQMDQIENAPEEALILLKINMGNPGTTVEIIEEG